MGMKILVTGAGGLLGAEIEGLARARGHRVLPLARAELNVTDKKSVSAAIKGSGLDTVVHCAAYTAVDRAESEPELARLVNRDGTQNVASICGSEGVDFVYLSTDYVFDGTKSTPYLPGDLPNPLSVYAKTKLEGEKVTWEVAGPALVVRLSWLYGDHKGFVPAVLRQALTADAPLRVVCDQVGQPTWVRNAASAIIELLEVRARGTVHVGDKGECSWWDLAQEVLRLDGKDRPVKAVSSEEFGAAALRPSYSVLDLTETEEVLGRSMPSWQDALRDFMHSKNR